MWQPVGYTHTHKTLLIAGFTEVRVALLGGQREVREGRDRALIETEAIPGDILSSART